jgi:hypothetical protein
LESQPERLITKYKWSRGRKVSDPRGEVVSRVRGRMEITKSL